MLQQFISKLPRALQGTALKLLYKKSGRTLQDFKVFNKKFYAYKLNGTYVPSETIGWFLDYEFYHDRMLKITGFEYQPKQGDVIVDIGAGIGEETLVFSKVVGSEGKVYAIEANSEVFEVLKRIKELNALDNVRLFNQAINGSNCEVEIVVEEDSFLGGTIGDTSNKTKSFKVEGVRLDSFIERNGLDKIDLLKVNIEGAERFVLETIGDKIDQIKHVAISCHDFRYKETGNDFFRTKELVTSYLIKTGFQITSQNTGLDYIDDWIYGSNKSVSE